MAKKAKHRKLHVNTTPNLLTDDPNDFTLQLIGGMKYSLADIVQLVIHDGTTIKFAQDLEESFRMMLEKSIKMSLIGNNASLEYIQTRTSNKTLTLPKHEMNPVLTALQAYFGAVHRIQRTRHKYIRKRFETPCEIRKFLRFLYLINAESKNYRQQIIFSMKHKILLLVSFMFACMLGVNAHQLTFKVKNAPFIADKNLLHIELFYGHEHVGSSYYNAGQDSYMMSEEIKEGNYSYTAYYEGDENHAGMLEYKGTIKNLGGDMTVTIDLGNYHLASFTAPEGYSMYGLTLQTTDDEGYEVNLENHKKYLPDGTYKYNGKVVRESDQSIFCDTQYRSVNIAGSDKNIVYPVNPAEYHRLTFNIMDYYGAPITDYNLNFQDENYMGGTANGSSTLMVPDGNYTYSLHVSNNSYKSREGTFTINGSDQTVKISYESYKKLALTVKGNVFSQLNEPRMLLIDPLHPYDNNWALFSPVKISDTEYLFEIYQEPIAKIEYRITNSASIDSKEMLPYTGTINLTENRTITVNLPEYYPVRFNVVDKQGNDENPVDYEILMSAGHLYESKYTTDNTLYMPSGNYKGRFYIVNEEVVPDQNRKAATRSNKDDGSDAIIYQEFTVGNEEKEVKVVYNSDLYFHVDVNLTNVPQSFQPYTSELYITLHKDNLEYADEYISNADIYVPEGTYTYTISNDKYGMVPLVGKVNITGNARIDLDFSNYGVVTARCVNPEGNPIKLDNYIAYLKDADNNITDIFIDAEYVNELILFAPTGTYQANVITKELQGEKPIHIIAGETGQEDITLTARQTGKHLVTFEIVDDTYGYEEHFNVELQSYGTVVSTNCLAYFDNVDTANDLTYTVSAPGYRTVTGTININGDTDICIFMQVENPNSIETIKGGDNICVYPTVADDYINIRANEQKTEAWSIRIISATGSVVYMDKELLDGEKQIYVGNLPKGFYLFTLSNGEQRMTYKILKK